MLCHICITPGNLGQFWHFKRCPTRFWFAQIWSDTIFTRKGVWHIFRPKYQFLVQFEKWSDTFCSLKCLKTCQTHFLTKIMSDTFSTWMKLCLTSFLDAALQIVSDHLYISGEFVSDTFFTWKCVWQVFSWIKIVSDSFSKMLLSKTTRWRYWPLGWKLPNIVRTALAISIRAFYGPVDKYFIPSMRTRKIWLDFRSWDGL